MTAVLLLGDIAATATGRIPLRRPLKRGQNPPLEPAFLEVIGDILDSDGGVLAVYPAWSWRRRVAERLIRLARSALGTDRVAGIPLQLPPLAIGVAADRLTALAPRVSPGTLAAVAHRMSDEIVAGAWVRSVTHLRHVEVPLRAHLASYLPGGFMVTVAPAGRICRITRRRQVAELGALPTAPATLLVADHGGDSGWVGRALVPALRAGTVTEVDAQQAGAAFWGTKRYVEFAAGGWNTDELLVSGTGRPCTWCDEPISLAACAFCGMPHDAMPTGRRQGHYTARHAAPASTSPPEQPARRRGRLGHGGDLNDPFRQPSVPVGKHARKQAT
jgi:hypothetical protein